MASVGDEQELQDLIGMPKCNVVGCANLGIDGRGPVFMYRDGVQVGYSVCQEHWEGVFDVLGNQSRGKRGEVGAAGATGAIGPSGLPTNEQLFTFDWIEVEITSEENHNHDRRVFWKTMEERGVGS